MPQKISLTLINDVNNNKKILRVKEGMVFWRKIQYTKLQCVGKVCSDLESALIKKSPIVVLIN
jgi:hypothetical protein